MHTGGRLVIAMLLALLGAELARSAPPTIAEWDASFARAVRDRSRKLAGFAKACDRDKLPALAWLLRQEALRWTPDDGDLRAKLGYVRVGETWEKNPVVREGLRKLEDTARDRVLRKIEKRIKSFRASAVRRFRGLAGQAASGAEAGDEPGWKKRVERAWRQVLVAVPDDKRAHEALGSKRIDGRFILPEWQPHLRVRRERLEAGRKRAALEFEAREILPDGPMSASGVNCGAARSGPVTVYSEFGRDTAKQTVIWLRRAYVDIEAEYGFPETIWLVMGKRTFYSVKSRTGCHQVLTRGFAWSDEKAGSQLDFASGAYPAEGSFVSWDPSVESATDACIQVLCRALARYRQVQVTRDESAPDDVEPWFLEALTLDVVVRLTGRALNNFVQKEHYRDEQRDMPLLNQWAAIASMRVLRDNDISMATLHKLRFNQLEEDEMAKGFTYLHFLFERDPDAARAFVGKMLATDTPTAIKKTYGKSLEEMDREYAEWVRWTL